jgi:hypothetical protein
MQKTELTKLNFEIIINAPKEKVWEKMLGDEGYRIWTNEFNPGGSWYEGSFEEGSKIKFLGPGEAGQMGGMASEIAVNRKYEFISIKHLGFILNGQEVTDTPEILAWAPAYENYTFTEEEGKTKVEVYVEVNPEWLEMMKGSWPKALEKLKEICEE